MLIKTCPLCMTPAQNDLRLPAIISPWLRSLAHLRQLTSDFYKCESCDLGFFSYRYNDAQMESIYRNYRGPEYVSIRSQWEPWYTQAFNERHDAEDWAGRRRETLEAFLASASIPPPRIIVDIGGDRGQYIPKLGQLNNYVLEASNKSLVHGVARISNLEELQDIDLIIYSHVLEHVTDPMNELNRLLQSANYVYVEVPYGIPETSYVRRSKLMRLLMLIVCQIPALYRKYTSPATGRPSLKRTLVQSEHVNFFTENSMLSMAKSLGAKITTAITEVPTPDYAKARVVQCVMSLHQDNDSH